MDDSVARADIARSRRTPRGWFRGRRTASEPLATPDNDSIGISADVPRVWYADDADSEEAPKHGRADFLRRAWEIIDEARSHPSSTVFALVGPWGSGKSSMLEWLRKQAAGRSATTSWSVITFNPWDYPDANSLQLGFFATLKTSFGESRLAHASKLLSDLGIAVAPFTAAAAAWGLYDPSKVVESAAKLLGGTHNADAARRKLIATLEQTRRPVLVVIDDIDRISADELLLTLKLIRQLGRLPYVHYLMSYDESTILDVLTRTNLIGEEHPGRARDYMEKVVQVRFDVPQLRPGDTLELANHALRDLSDDTGHSFSDDGSERFASAFFAFMADRLTTPRSLRRYFAQARLLSERLAGEVDLSDFLVLTWIRTLEPGVYALIQRRRSQFIGELLEPRSADAAENAAARATARTEWESALLHAGTRKDDVQAVLLALTSLSPRFASAIDIPRSRNRPAPPRISHEEYFDRYFSVGIPHRDVADATIRRALADMESDLGELSTAVARARLSLLENRELTISKIARIAEELQVEQRPTFAWLTEIYLQDLATEEPLRSAFAIQRLIANRLRLMTPDQAQNALHAMAMVSNGGILIANTVNAAMHLSSVADGVLTLTVAIQTVTTASLRNAITAEHATTEAMSWQLWIAAQAWREIDPEGFGHWVREETQLRGGIAGLAQFVRLSRSVGASGNRMWIDHVDIDEASHYLDLDDVRRQYATDIAAAPSIDLGAPEKLPDNPNNRQLAVLNALRDIPSP